MAAYIGDVQFPTPLEWTNKGAELIIGGSQRTVSGNLVTVTVENPSQKYIEAHVTFTWIPLASVQTLIDYWASGETYQADIEDTGEVRTVRFHPLNGVVKWKHQHGLDEIHSVAAGEDGDRYSGELNLIIES